MGDLDTKYKSRKIAEELIKMEDPKLKAIRKLKKASDLEKAVKESGDSVLIDAVLPELERIRRRVLGDYVDSPLIEFPFMEETPSLNKKPESCEDFMKKIREGDKETPVKPNEFPFLKETNNISKKGKLLLAGYEYVKSQWDDKRKVPTKGSWDSEKVSAKEIDKRFGSFRKYISRIFKTEPGINLRKEITKTLYFSDKDYKIVDLAQKIKLSSCTVDRDFEQMGVITTKKVSKNFNDLATLKNKEIYGAKPQSLEETLERRFDEVVENLSNPNEVRYLGLERPHFTTLHYLSKKCKIDSGNSLIVEKDEKTYNIMRSLAKNSKSIEGGEVLEDLNLYHGNMLEAITDSKYKYSKFNFVNLDFAGELKNGNVEVIKRLFENEQFTEGAVLLINKNYAADGGKVVDALSNLIFTSADKAGYCLEHIGAGPHYQSKKGEERILMMYKIRKS